MLKIRANTLDAGLATGDKFSHFCAVQFSWLALAFNLAFNAVSAALNTNSIIQTHAHLLTHTNTRTHTHTHTHSGPLKCETVGVIKAF